MPANYASEGPMLPAHETITSAGSVTPPRPKRLLVFCATNVRNESVSGRSQGNCPNDCFIHQAVAAPDRLLPVESSEV